MNRLNKIVSGSTDWNGEDNINEQRHHGVVGDFVAETLGCRARRILTTNKLAKHILILFVLYVTITFSLQFDEGKTENPSHVLIFTLSIYIIFILFTKMNMIFTGVVSILFIITFFIYNYIEYYKKKDPSNHKLPILKYVRNVLNIVMIGLILVGFILYCIKQYKIAPINWRKLIFDPPKCSSLQ